MTPRNARRPIAATLAAILALVAVQSCGSNNSSTTPSGAIGLSLSVASTTIAPGGQAAVVGTVTRSGGFSGDVAIVVSGAPTSVTGTVGSVSTIGTTSTATVTIAAGALATAGSYPLTVTASGSGVTSVTTSFTLIISATAQNYTLTVAPTGGSIAPGASGTAIVAINRNGFAGSVNLSVPNLPAGFTATFSPNNTTGTTSTMTVTLAASVSPGLYPVDYRWRGDRTAGSADILQRHRPGRRIVFSFRCADDGQHRPGRQHHCDRHGDALRRILR